MFRMSVLSGEPTSSPKVRLKPTSRGPRHWANEGAERFGVPNAFMVCLRKVPPIPWLKSAIASGPCSTRIAFIRSAM